METEGCIRFGCSGKDVSDKVKYTYIGRKMEFEVLSLNLLGLRCAW